MNSVIKNIVHLCDRSKSTTWVNSRFSSVRTPSLEGSDLTLSPLFVAYLQGHDGWKKVVVVVVSDGRKPCNPRTLKVLQLMGAYAEGVMKDHGASRLSFDRREVDF